MSYFIYSDEFISTFLSRETFDLLFVLMFIVSARE